jgi:hypothetical protein
MMVTRQRSQTYGLQGGSFFLPSDANLRLALLIKTIFHSASKKVLAILVINLSLQNLFVTLR